MVAYTNYPSDARVRREAETIAAQPEYEVTFLTLKEGDIPRTYKKDDVLVREVDIQKYQGKSRIKYVYSYLKFLLTAFNAVNGLLISGKIDIVHVHNMPNFLVFAALGPRIFGKKVILDIHDSIPETYLSKFESRRNEIVFKLLCLEESICCRMAHRIVCVNHVQRDGLVERGLDAAKIFISMNVPDPRIFKRDSGNPAPPEKPDGFNLVYHGTVSKRLGIDIAIQAVAKLKDKIPQLRFNVLGLGDDLEEFIELAANLGIRDLVYFSRRVDPIEEIVELVRHMDLGVISNRRNLATEFMLPVKMLEYVSLGIPIVAPRLKAIQYYFDQDMVRYFEPEDVDSLARAILELYTDPELRGKQVAEADRFLGIYGWDNHKFDLLNVYRELRGAAD